MKINPKKQVISVITGILFEIAVLLFLYYGSYEQLSQINLKIIIFTTLSACLSFLCIPFIFNKIDTFNNNQQYPYYRFILRLLGLFFCIAIVNFLFFSLYFFLYHHGAFKNYFILNKIFIIKYLVVLFLSLVTFCATDLFAYLYKKLAKNKYDHEKRLNLELKLQFEILKNQLSPHFLFNNLNSISELIYSNVSLSEKYIRSLMKIYDYIAESYDYKIIKLEKELVFLLHYFTLLKIKHGDAIQLIISISEKLLQFNIPPVTLQMLMENAMKHNAFSITEPLILEISARNNHFLEVRNKINKKQNTQLVKSKIGLDNIRSRYRLFSNLQIKITENEYFTVILPLIFKDKTNE
jgi:sensor histidine kinase YesM